MSAWKLRRRFACGVFALALGAFLISRSVFPSNLPPLAETIPLFALLTAFWHVQAALSPSSWDVLGPGFTFHEGFPDSASGLLTCAVITAAAHGLLYFLLNVYVPKWSDRFQGRLPASSLLPTAMTTLALWLANAWYLQAASTLGRQYQGEPYVHMMFWFHIIGGLSLIGTIVLRYWFHRKKATPVSAVEILALNGCLYALLLFVFFPYFGEVL